MKQINFFLLVTVVGVLLFTNAVLASTDSVSENIAGQITSIASGQLYIKSQSGNKLHTLAVHDQLHVGDTVMVSLGAQAVLNLTRPSNVSEDDQLVMITPLPGKHYTVIVRLQDKTDSIEAAINSVVEIKKITPTEKVPMKAPTKKQRVPKVMKKLRK